MSDAAELHSEKGKKASGWVIATARASTPSCAAWYVRLVDAHQAFSTISISGPQASAVSSSRGNMTPRVILWSGTVEHRILCFVQDARSDAAPACRLCCWHSAMPASSCCRLTRRQRTRPPNPIPSHTVVNIDLDYSTFFWATIEYIMAPGPDAHKTVNCKSKNQTDANQTLPLRSENPFFLLQRPDRAPDHAASFCHLQRHFFKDSHLD